MNFLGGLKNKISGIYKNTPENEVDGPMNKRNNNLDYEDVIHTLNVLQDENKILKSKVRVLENSVMGYSDQNDRSQFGQLFNELKSTFTFSNNNSIDNTKTTISEFKNFLADNMLYHNNIDEEDIEFLNNIQITDGDWDKNKELFIFKQKILEKNYNDMFNNMLISRELNEYFQVNSRAKTERSNSKTGAENKNSHSNEDITLIDNIKITPSVQKVGSAEQKVSNELENILLADTIKSVEELDLNLPSSIPSITKNTSSDYVKKKTNNQINKDSTPVLQNILAIDEDIDLAAVLKPQISTKPDTNKSQFNNMNQTSKSESNTGKITTTKISFNKNVSNNDKNDEEDKAKNILNSLLNEKDSESKLVKNTNRVSQKNTTTNSNLNRNSSKDNNKTVKYAWDEELEDL